MFWIYRPSGDFYVFLSTKNNYSKFKETDSLL